NGRRPPPNARSTQGRPLADVLSSPNHPATPAPVRASWGAGSLRRPPLWWLPPEPWSPWPAFGPPGLPVIRPPSDVALKAPIRNRATNNRVRQFTRILLSRKQTPGVPASRTDPREAGGISPDTGT